MKKKTSFQLISFCSPLFLGVFFACALVQTGCNNAGGQPTGTSQPKIPHNWITVDITFKPNTTEEFREKAIRAIKKMWIKSVAPVMQKYPDLHPSISVTQIPSLDSLKYRLSLLSTFYSKSGSGEYTLMSKTITPPCCSTTPIVCPCLCPACDTSMRTVSSNYSIAKLTYEK